MKKKSESEIRGILSQVSFMDRNFRLLSKGGGFLLQVTYEEMDVNGPPNSPPVEQRGRKWYLSPWMTETEIVETAFAAVCRSMLHIVGEHFTYIGRRVYSPHFDIGARIELCCRERFDKRDAKGHA